MAIQDLIAIKTMAVNLKLLLVFILRLVLNSDYMYLVQEVGDLSIFSW